MSEIKSFNLKEMFAQFREKKFHRIPALERYDAAMRDVYSDMGILPSQISKLAPGEYDRRFTLRNIRNWYRDRHPGTGEKLDEE